MNIADYLDAAILKPGMSRAEAMAAAESCIPYKPKTLCMRPSDLPDLSPVCRQHGMGVCVVLGFPHGCQLPASKIDEAKRYLDLGVDEIDMVCNIGWVRSGEWDRVRDDIAGVSAVTRTAGTPLKVIFETCFLEPEEIRRLTEVCIEAKADFVKTSTGFNGEGAKMEDVKIMLETAAGRIKVKPSGGIRTPEQARAYIDMGASRLGVGYSSVPALCGHAESEPGEGY
jgi:deoxyribose-phosphate aldolase